MKKLTVSSEYRKPSEILQLMLDRQIYDPEKQLSIGMSNHHMCTAVLEAYRRNIITIKERNETRLAIKVAIKGEYLLQSYLQKNLGISLGGATNPRNKILFYKGLIRRLEKAGN